MSVAHVLAIAGADDLGSGRTVPTLAAVLGLISMVVGGLAVARSAGRTRSRRAGSIVALATGLISMITVAARSELGRRFRHGQRAGRGARGPGAGPDRRGARRARRDEAHGACTEPDTEDSR